MQKFIFVLLVTAACLLMKFSFSQELPRSASFGAAVSDLNDSLKTMEKLSSVAGTILNRVIAGSSAEKAGFVAHDVLVSIDGQPIKNTNHFLELLKNYHGGDKVKIEFYRQSKLSTITMVLLPRQMETSAEYDIIYSSVSSGTNLLRTIITKPRERRNKYPAVLLIGGVGCYSVDNPFLPEIMSLRTWADSLTKNGFVTIRVEKTGMGDSKGISCKECDFNTEKQGFADGLKQLKALPYVDQEKIFIAGFSMGGVIAPLIALEQPVKGIIAYGTVGRNWLEYELDNSLRQQLLDNRPADSVDEYMRAEYIRLYGLFAEKKTPSQITKEHPEAAANFFNYPMRTEYFQQVADINIRELWMKTNSKVLVMHGSSDFVSSGPEHQLIADIVNHYHPGNATYIEAANADHWEFLTKTELESSQHVTTTFNPIALNMAMKWLRENL